MIDVVPYPDPLALLASRGERLGWVFRDRNVHRRAFVELAPVPGVVPPYLQERLNRARRGMARRALFSLGVGVGLAFLIGCCGGGLSSLGGSGDGGARVVVVFLALLALAGGIVGAVMIGVWPEVAKKAISNAQQQIQREHAQAYAVWDVRRQWFERQEQQRVDAMYEWIAATPSPGTGRVDIVGGTMYGWEAVLTVFGGSLLATRGRMVLVDFTGEALCGELMELALVTDRSVHELRFPSQLAQFDLVGGLDPAELVDCLVEAMYGDAQAAERAERHQDGMLLREICGVLAPDVTVVRLLAAVRVLADWPAQPALTDEESNRLLDLQPDEARRQMHPRLRRIEAFLHPLETMGSASADHSVADFTCLLSDGGGGAAEGELFKDLMVQWLARQVRRESVPLGSLILVGADEVSHRSIEKLSALCERHAVRLVLFFSHLRRESVQTIGGGDVGLMRMGNHQEANQAAEFVGRSHRFVLTQLTRTLGGNDTHTSADTYGESQTDGGSDTRGGSVHRGLRPPGMMWLRNPTRSYGTSWGATRNWSRTVSVAKGINWADAVSVQRVYEYTLEPRVLQGLPEYAMVLVKGHGRGSVIQAVEVNPAIVTLPRVSMDPVESLREPAEVVFPAARQPGQVTVAPPPLTGYGHSPQAVADPPPLCRDIAPDGEYPKQPSQSPWDGQP